MTVKPVDLWRGQCTEEGTSPRPQQLIEHLYLGMKNATWLRNRGEGFHLLPFAVKDNEASCFLAIYGLNFGGSSVEPAV